jgi:hypothetical protein
VSELLDDRSTLRKLSDTIIIERSGDTTAVVFDTDVKGAGVALDFGGELNAVRERMAEATQREVPNVVMTEPGGSTATLTAQELAELSYEERLLHDAKQKIAEGEYAIALKLLGDLLSLDPEQESLAPSEAIASASGSPAAAPTAAGPKQRGGISERREVGRNDPCPCGSGKKYKRCHGA